jgi:ribosomal protein L21
LPFNRVVSLVGRRPGAWRLRVPAAARVFTALAERGIRPWLLDLGGGFPAHLEDGAPPLAAYGATIELALRRSFDDAGLPRPQTLVEPGQVVTFDRVLMVNQDGKITIGSPTVPSATVQADVVGHIRGEKKIAFKMKRRKGYHKTIGHRQELTELTITGINV